jgi:hypothetical protein
VPLAGAFFFFFLGFFFFFFALPSPSTAPPSPASLSSSSESSWSSMPFAVPLPFVEDFAVEPFVSFTASCELEHVVREG